MKDRLNKGDKRHNQVKAEKAELESRNQKLVNQVATLTKELQSATDSVKAYEEEKGRLQKQLHDLKCVVPDNRCTYCFTYQSVTYGLCKYHNKVVARFNTDHR